MIARVRRWAGAPGALVALAVVLAVVQAAPLLFQQSIDGRAWHWWGYVAAVGASLPVMAVRRYPVAVLLVSITVSASYDLVEPVAPQPLWYGVLVGVYGLANWSGPWVRVVVFTLICGVGLATVGSLNTAMRGILMYVAAYALGRAAASARARTEALAEHTLRLERERRRDEERAAERERARIARDMHDILAHSITLMVVQAEAGPVVVEHSPRRAADAFDAIAEAGRDALSQLRRLLAILKEEDVSRAPQPTIEDLPVLVRQVGGAGPAAVYRVEGEPRAVPADCGVAVYRIVQESLTNIVKHAEAEQAEVHIRWHDDALEITITDDGRGADTARPAGGHGLIGIRERAAACGGTAVAGARPDGRPGFEVTARLPLAADPVTESREGSGAA